MAQTYVVEWTHRGRVYPCYQGGNYKKALRIATKYYNTMGDKDMVSMERGKPTRERGRGGRSKSQCIPTPVSIWSLTKVKRDMRKGSPSPLALAMRHELPDSYYEDMALDTGWQAKDLRTTMQYLVYHANNKGRPQ